MINMFLTHVFDTTPVAVLYLGAKRLKLRILGNTFSSRSELSIKYHFNRHFCFFLPNKPTTELLIHYSCTTCEWRTSNTQPPNHPNPYFTRNLHSFTLAHFIFSTEFNMPTAVFFFRFGISSKNIPSC